MKLLVLINLSEYVEQQAVARQNPQHRCRVGMYCPRPLRAT